MGELCTDFPTNVPEETIEFIFNDCRFTNIESVPYRQAVSLMILHTPASNFDIADGAFEQLGNLSTLELQGNRLQIRGKEMFRGLSKLKVLSLVANSIKLVPEDAFMEMTSLKELKLSQNPNLNLPPKSFTSLTELEKLELDQCGLTEVPVEAFKELKDLRVLSLNENPIKSVPRKAFDELEDLQELHLLGCGLEEVKEEAFDGLDSLLYLDLSANKLKGLDEDLLHASKDTMKEFFINDNLLTALPEDLLEWKNLLELRMAGNPWACDCTNVWMQQLQLTTKENLTCASPPETLGHNLLNATLALDCPTTNRSVIMMAVIIPLMIVCGCLIIYLVYKILQAKKRREGQRNVRYSSVYKDTVETVSGGGMGGAKSGKGKPVPEL